MEGCEENVYARVVGLEFEILGWGGGSMLPVLLQVLFQTLI